MLAMAIVKEEPKLVSDSVMELQVELLSVVDNGVLSLRLKGYVWQVFVNADNNVGKNDFVWLNSVILDKSTGRGYATALKGSESKSSMLAAVVFYQDRKVVAYGTRHERGGHSVKISPLSENTEWMLQQNERFEYGRLCLFKLNDEEGKRQVKGVEYVYGGM